MVKSEKITYIKGVWLLTKIAVLICDVNAPCQWGFFLRLLLQYVTSFNQRHIKLLFQTLCMHFAVTSRWTHHEDSFNCRSIFSFQKQMLLTQRLLKLIDKVIERLVRLAHNELFNEVEEKFPHLVILQVLLYLL